MTFDNVLLFLAADQTRAMQEQMQMQMQMPQDPSKAFKVLASCHFCTLTYIFSQFTMV